MSEKLIMPYKEKQISLRLSVQKWLQLLQNIILFKLDITNELPCETSSLNFSDEAHVVAKSQIFEEIISSDQFVYACDGTSRQEVSFLEQHIILSSGKQLPLGSEDSDTLLSTGKCVDAFREIIEVDCLDSTEDEESLLKEVIRKMKGLLSDRAAVMKPFDKKLHNFKVDCWFMRMYRHTSYTVMPTFCWLSLQHLKKQQNLQNLILLKGKISWAEMPIQNFLIFKIIMSVLHFVLFAQRLRFLDPAVVKRVVVVRTG